MADKKKICLGLLSNRGFKPDTVMSLLDLVNQNTEYEIIPVISPTCFTIAEYRNWLVARASKLECEFILMVDDDMVFPPETLSALVKRNVDIIGVPYHTKQFPKKTTILPLEGSRASETVFGEVSAVGTGIILIKTSILSSIPQPWFEFQQNEFGMTIDGEDWVFCKKARKAGFRVWSEPLEIGHVGDYIY